MRQIYLDLETTGLSPQGGDRIIEVGAVEAIDGHLSSRELHAYFNPGRTSHPDALRVHGLRDEFLADKPGFERLVGPLSVFLEGADLFIHNAGFDIPFLQAEFDRAGHPPPFAVTFGAAHDTLPMFKAIWPGERCNLEAVCQRLLVETPTDCEGTLKDAKSLAIACWRVQSTIQNVWTAPAETDPGRFREALRWVKQLDPWPKNFGIAMLQRKYKLNYSEGLAWMNKLIGMQYVRLGPIEGKLGYARCDARDQDLAAVSRP